jgi:hypothetical protein
VEHLNKKFIVLRPDSIGYEVFLTSLCETGDQVKECPVDQMVYDAGKVRVMLDTVDTEWDRKVVRVALCANRTRKEINDLGIDVETVKKDTSKVL